MKFLRHLRARARHLLHPAMNPAQAYDRWAASYDAQPENLMLALDEEIFRQLLSRITCRGKIVLDLGCGTGRHWKKLLAHSPRKLIGYDVSAVMLQELQKKFPQAQTQLIADGQLPYAEDGPAGVLVSTLALAHLENPARAMRQWQQVLGPGADILLTDYHPETLALGGDRTFPYQGKTIAIRNYVHPLEKVRRSAADNGFEIMAFTEKRIDAELRPWYEKQGGLQVYNRFEGAGIIYGMHLKKAHAAA
ncbi:MAG: class I SAM-dependent methyltransferase [Adhaeribacter sp.]